MERWWNEENKVNVTRSWNFFAGDYYTCNVITQISPHTALKIKRGTRRRTRRRNQRRFVVAVPALFCTFRGNFISFLCTSQKAEEFLLRKHKKKISKTRKMREKRIKCTLKMENRKWRFARCELFAIKMLPLFCWKCKLVLCEAMLWFTTASSITWNYDLFNA